MYFPANGLNFSKSIYNRSSRLGRLLVFLHDHPGSNKREMCFALGMKNSWMDSGGNEHFIKYRGWSSSFFALAKKMGLIESHRTVGNSVTYFNTSLGEMLYDIFFRTLPN